MDKDQQNHAAAGRGRLVRRVDTRAFTVGHVCGAPLPWHVDVQRPYRPDALPAASGVTTSLTDAQRAMRAEQDLIRHDYPAAVALRVGPGGGYAWAYTPTGSVVVLAVKDYSFYVRLTDLRDCPTGEHLYRSYTSGIDLAFIAPLVPSSP